MKVITHLDQPPPLKPPIALTIGVYDGIHLGHQRIFKELHKYTRAEGTRVILTFSNHPTTLFTPEKPLPSIISLDHRLHLLESFGFDLVILLPFDQTLAKLPYDTFIKNLRAKLPFKHLVLGSDAHLGKNRAGTPSAICALGEELHFTSAYLPKETYHKEPISSGRIREHLARGELKKVKKMLGRSYSIRVPFKDPTRESEMQYRLDYELEDLSPLPSAVYAIDIGSTPAIAFYRAAEGEGAHTKISLTLYFEHPPLEESHLTLNFISHLHNTLDPELGKGGTLLEGFIPQPSPS